MTLIAANAALYWLSFFFDLPGVASYLPGLSGCLAGALFLRALLLARPATRAYKLLSAVLLVWTYPVCALIHAVAMTQSGFQHLIPDSLVVMSAMVLLMYPSGQVAVAIILRNFSRAESGAVTAPRYC